MEQEFTTQPSAVPSERERAVPQAFIIPLAILIAAIMISGSILYTRTGTSGRPAAVAGQPEIGTTAPAGARDVSIDDDPVLGDANAKVTVIEFSDFQCPFCRQMWRNTLPQLKKEYIDTGKIRFVYRDFPLNFHEGAAPYAQAAECAEDQGKFWEYHDKIFAEQDKQGQGTIAFDGIATLKTWARELGLNGAEFDQCLDSGKYRAEVEKDFADGQAAGVSGTPTTFINGRSLIGAQPFDSFKALIEEELKK